MIISDEMKGRPMWTAVVLVFLNSVNLLRGLSPQANYTVNLLS
jgi:hypothetical protein